MRGSVELIQAGARAWRGYRDAVAAAAVAQSAMGGANVASAGGAGAAVGFGSRFGLLRYIPHVAAAAGGYFAGKWTAKKLGLGPGPERYASATERQTGAERGREIANREISQRTAMEANRREWYGSTIQSQMFGREESPQARLQANRLEMAELQRRSVATIGWHEQKAKGYGTAAAVRHEATGKYDEGTQRLEAQRAQHLLAADRERLEMLRESKRLTEERGQAEIDAARKSGEYAKAALLTAKQQVEEAQKKAKVAREEYSSAKQRFGLLDPREQRKHVALKAKLDRGENLSRTEVNYLWESGDKETQAALGRRAEQLAEAGGWSDRYYSPAESATAQAESVASRASFRTEAESRGYSGLMSTATEKKIVHRIEVDVMAQQDQISQKVGQVLQRITDDIRRGADSTAKREAQLQIDRDRLNQDSRAESERGG